MSSEKRKPDPARVAILRSLPAEVKATITGEEADQFIYTDALPESLYEKIRDFLVESDDGARPGRPARGLGKTARPDPTANSFRDHCGPGGTPPAGRRASRRADANVWVFVNDLRLHIAGFWFIVPRYFTEF